MKKIILATLAATCLISAVAETETTNMSVTGTVLKDYCQIVTPPVFEFGTIDTSDSGSWSTMTHNSNTYYNVGAGISTTHLTLDCNDGTTYSLYGDYDADGFAVGDARMLFGVDTWPGTATKTFTPTNYIVDNTAVGSTSSLEVTTAAGATSDIFVFTALLRSASGDLSNLPEDLAASIPLVMVVN